MKHESWWLKNVALLFAIPVVIGAILLTGWSGMGVLRGSASTHWPATDGTVTGLDIQHRALSIGRFEPRVTYFYMIEGIAYDSDRIWPLTGVQYATYNETDTFLKDYPGGGRIRVHYDPKNPADSVLVPGVQSADYFLLAAGVFMLIISAYLLVEHFRARKS